MLNEGRQIASGRADNATSEMIGAPQPSEYAEREGGPASAASRSKLSVNVSHEIAERLRNLAYIHRLSESSIVEVALAMFFTRGDDALLGLMLKQLGAVLRKR